MSIAARRPRTPRQGGVGGPSLRPPARELRDPRPRGRQSRRSRLRRRAAVAEAPPPKEYSDRLDQVLRNSTAGLYEWGGAIFTTWVHTDAGLARTLWLSFQYARQEIKEEEVLRMVRDPDKGKEIYGKFLELNFPNLKPPAQPEAPAAPGVEPGETPTP